MNACRNVSLLLVTHYNMCRNNLFDKNVSCVLVIISELMLVLPVCKMLRSSFINLLVPDKEFCRLPAYSSDEYDEEYDSPQSRVTKTTSSDLEDGMTSEDYDSDDSDGMEDYLDNSISVPQMVKKQQHRLNSKPTPNRKVVKKKQATVKVL